MATEYSSTLVWVAIVTIGVATFAIRGSFIALFGRLDEVPSSVERTLRFVPAAVLAAIVAPSLLAVDPTTGALQADKLVAGGLAIAVAWRTENMFATMVAGMGALWIVRFFIL